MADLDAAYDIDHRKAAFENHETGILVCLAGPGTGKTSSLLARSAALATRGCAQEAICYLTFIKDISSAFVDDYVQRFGEAAYAADPPRISTLHSFACRLIRNQGFRFHYDGDLYFTNLADSDDDAPETFLRDLLPYVAGSGCRTVSQLREGIDTLKKKWQDAEDPATSPEPGPSILAPLLAVARAFRLLDWDQTIPLASGLIDEMAELPEWLSKIKHYFIDEYQDFNRAEQVFVLRLAAKATSTVVVGDDDQSIYSSRGGSPDGLLSLYSDPGHDQVTLAKCYRCKRNIVVPTNQFQGVMNPSPRPMTPAFDGGTVLSYRFKSSKAEGAFLVEYLKARIDELPPEPRQKDGIVCLFPSWRILDTYFDILSPHLPCTRKHRDVSPDRLWLQRFLSLLVRPQQRFLQRLFLRQYSDVKPRHRVKIVQRVVERDTSPVEACQSLLDHGEFTGRALTAVQAYVSDCGNLADRNFPELVTHVSAKLTIAEAQVAAQLYQLLAADDSTGNDLLEGTCDSLLPDTASTAPDPRAVAFLTMHGSKGLTRKTVVLPGLEEACLPGGAKPEDLPEKRRVFFVALSRATDNLLLTFPLHRGGDRLNFDMPGRGVESTLLTLAGLRTQYHA